MHDCPFTISLQDGIRMEQYECVFFHRDGTPIPVSASNAPIRRAGEVVGAVAILADISARRRVEQALATALATQQALTQEVRHRVKNSLQMVASLLHLQAGSAPHPAAREQLLEAARRVVTVARVHERLHQVSDVQTVEFGAFLWDLCADIARTTPSADRVAWHVAVDPMDLPTDVALPLALVANELLTNALKHAFTDGRSGTIHVRFGPQDGGWALRVADDGVGLPDGFDPQATSSLGMRLAGILTQQLRSRLAVASGPGAAFTVTGPR